MTPRRTILSALPVAALLALPGAAPAQETPSADFPFEKRSVEVLGSTMTYVDEGTGPVVLFLHGNPTSSYLWRNIIPYVSDDHRAIAPDLIGMGDSGKPDIDYSYDDHRRYLEAFIDALDLTEMTLVIHDWGSVLGMEHARLHPGDIRGVAFMEAGIPPALPAPSLEAMGPQNAELFGALRTPGVGEKMVLEENFFVEVVLGQMAVATPLSDDVMAQYRAPFPTPESRKPTLAWPRQIPIAGEPAETAAVVTANGEWLYETEVPKLMFSVKPGALMPPPVVDYVRSMTTNLTHVALGEGVHFVQEDHPDAIGAALDAWLAELPR